MPVESGFFLAVDITRRIACAVAPFFQNPLVDFFTVHLDLWRCLDTDSNLIPLYPQYGDCDVITDDKLLSNSSCQNEQRTSVQHPVLSVSIH